MTDYFDVLFNPHRPFVPTRISGGTTNGRIISERPPDPENHLDQREKLMFEEDVDKIRQELKQKLIAIDTEQIDEPTTDRPMDEVYKKYNFSHRTQTATQLPVHAFKSEILTKISEFPAVVIEGSTGCGKTTQVNYLNGFVVFWNIVEYVGFEDEIIANFSNKNKRTKRSRK